jgi:hypothetical protein
MTGVFSTVLGGIPWYFNPSLWRECVQMNKSEVCQDIISEFETYCPQDNKLCKKLRNNTTAWTGIAITSIEIEMPAYYMITAEQAAFFGGRLPAVGYLLNESSRQEFWKSVLSNYKKESPTINVQFSWLDLYNKGLIAPDREFLFRTYGVNDLLLGFSPNNIAVCANMNECVELTKEIVNKCPDLLVSTLLDSKANSSDQIQALFVGNFTNCLREIVNKQQSGEDTTKVSTDPETIFVSDKNVPFTIEKKLGEGVYGLAFKGTYNSNQAVAVKFNKLVTDGRQWPYHSLNRDIQGMLLGEEWLRKDSQWWIPKLLDTIKYYDHSSSTKELPFVLSADPNNEVVVPGIIMEYFEQQEDTGEIKVDNHLFFCKHIQAVRAAFDLYKDGLLHEDLHVGNVILVKGEESMKISLAGSEEQEICPLLKVIDTGSLNTLDSKLDQVVDIFPGREINPQVSFCGYLRFLYYQFDIYKRIRLTPEQSKLSGAMLDEIIGYMRVKNNTDCTDTENVAKILNTKLSRIDAKNIELSEIFNQALERNRGSKASARYVEFSVGNSKVLLKAQKRGKSEKAKRITKLIAMIAFLLLGILAFVFLMFSKNPW